MENDSIWKHKLLAFIHDPAEKALILLRGKGHEAGTVAALKELFGEELGALRSQLQEQEALVKRADRWAAAADRPSLPRGIGGRVVFADDPQLIHPLTGERFQLSSLAGDIDPAHAEAVSFDHFQKLVVKTDGAVDWRRTFLAFWRFGPETPVKDLGVLWEQLPADTRSPDHTIWEHLSLASAFAGAMATSPQEGPALLLVSFGPVQGFIAQARSVSDLWAGSHILSRIAWEGMKVVCEACGPDAVLFPNLRGLALPDLWLWRELGNWPADGKPFWMTARTDANPLFAAALPNRFVALVPAGRAHDLVQEIEGRVHSWVSGRAAAALEELLTLTGLSDPGDAPTQIKRQLRDFPEIHWTVVPWHLAGTAGLEDAPLKELLQTLGAPTPYLDESLDGIVRREITVDGVEFYTPNAGVGYPGLFEAMERVHAAAKSARRFSGGAEEGYRCSLCGEREWLTVSRGDLAGGTGLFAPPQQRGETVWQRLAKVSPSLAKDGEYLCTLCTLKRFWPRLFEKEVKASVPGLEQLDRFVLSTHAMAVSTSLWNQLEKEARQEPLSPSESRAQSEGLGRLQAALSRCPHLRGATLPHKLFARLQDHDHRDFYRKIPALMDELQENSEGEALRSAIAKFLGKTPETYYALVLMDGDRLGMWLAGEKGRLKLEARFHEKCLEDLRMKDALRSYLAARRPASPALHQAISTALNSFALHLSRTIVEELFMGKLIYAGGDDLMAMVAVHDLPALMFALRCAYSGRLPEGMDNATFWKELEADPGRVKLKGGFALLQQGRTRKLLRLMGDQATASIGAVIAHHQAPLGRVLTELRQAENRAKTDGGRDAFCLTIMKRSGGTSSLVGKWALDAGWRLGHMGLLMDLRRLIAGDVSRRAAFALSEALKGLPADPLAVASVLRWQFQRQVKDKQKEVGDIPERLAEASRKAGQKASCLPEWEPGNYWLRNMLLTAEFLAREGRVAENENGGKRP